MCYLYDYTRPQRCLFFNADSRVRRAFVCDSNNVLKYLIFLLYFPGDPQCLGPIIVVVCPGATLSDDVEQILVVVQKCARIYLPFSNLSIYLFAFKARHFRFGSGQFS